MRVLAWLPVGLLLATVASCFSVEVQTPTRYRVEAKVASGEALSQSLRVEPFSVAPHLRTESLSVRVGDYSIERYPYELWAAPLEDLMTEAAVRALQGCGRFRQVLRAGERARADWALQGHVLDFQGLEIDGLARGEVRIEWTLREEKSDRLVWKGVLSELVSARASGAAGTVEALNKSYGKVLQALLEIADEKGKAEASPTSGRTP